MKAGMLIKQLCLREAFPRFTWEARGRVAIGRIPKEILPSPHPFLFVSPVRRNPGVVLVQGPDLKQYSATIPRYVALLPRTPFALLTLALDMERRAVEQLKNEPNLQALLTVSPIERLALAGT